MVGKKIPVVRNERNKWAVQARTLHGGDLRKSSRTILSSLRSKNTRFSKEDSEESRRDSAHENLLVRLTRRDVFVRLLKEKRTEEREGSRGRHIFK